MRRLEKALKTVKSKNEMAFVPYLMAGDGGLETLMERIIFLESCGATAVEIGIPFSDPVADGPTIQAAGLRALHKGTTLRGVLEKIQEMRPIVSIPLIVMTYTNPIYSYGVADFIHDAGKAGIDGLIIPDLPVEEEQMLSSHLKVSGLDLIRLVTLTSSQERMQEIVSGSQGFVYAVTVTGITGTRAEFQETVGDYLKKLKSLSPVPVLAGFGISTPEQVKEMGQYCDGVVVGSKIVELFHENGLKDIKNLIQAAKTVTV